MVVEEPHDLAGRLDLEEGGEDQPEPALHLLVGMLDHAPQRVAHQADRQGQGQFAALGLVEQPGGQAGLIVCSSSSEIKPFRPRISRPLIVAGS